ncbi:MAG: stage II sporulation protein R [Clostridia bacterium]|nr:stage II sporulation protein R [Clostridia bacterium]MDD4376135.1 stage II sporulation protein R [Clostridia bacterium]
MRKITPIYIAIFAFIILNFLITFISLNNQNIKENFFRIHVVANSNSIDDQLVKYKVAKNIDSYVENLYENSDNLILNKDDSKNIINSHINEILNLTESTLSSNSCNYSSYIKLGNISYDKKTSGNFTMASGVYDSVQIVLGDGKGENWWSLVFPYSYDNSIILNENKDEEMKSKEDEIFNNAKNIEYKFGIIEKVKSILGF